MEVLGLVFVGTRTPHAEAMRGFVQDVLGLAPAPGEHAAFFALPDGSSFAVQDSAESRRTVGFLVADVAAAAAELRERGVEVDEVTETETSRYVHVPAPDGQLYELVERR